MTVKADELTRKMQKTLGKDSSLPEGFGKMLLDELDRVMSGYFEYGAGDLALRLIPTGRVWSVEIILDAVRVKSLRLL